MVCGGFLKLAAELCFVWNVCSMEVCWKTYLNEGAVCGVGEVVCADSTTSLVLEPW